MMTYSQVVRNTIHSSVISEMIFGTENISVLSWFISLFPQHFVVFLMNLTRNYSGYRGKTPMMAEQSS
jgi:hypothetical protein